MLLPKIDEWLEQVKKACAQHDLNLEDLDASPDELEGAFAMGIDPEEFVQSYTDTPRKEG